MSEALETSETIRRIGVEPEDPVMLQWAKYRDLFAEAMGPGFWTIDDLEAKIATKRAFLIPGRNAALITEIVSYPGGERAMQATWACGDVDEIVTMIPGVEALARMMGCTSALVEGRSAWTKVLKPYGFEQFSVTLRKAL